jgi:hypothetical protein
MLNRNKISPVIGGWLTAFALAITTLAFGIQAVPVAAQGAVIPSSPAEDVVAYLRVREPNKLLDRVGMWAGLVNPGMNRDMMAMMLQGSTGIDLNEMQTGGNAIAMFYFDMESMNMKHVAMLPVTADGAAAQTFRQQLGPANVGGGAGRLLISGDPGTLGKAQGLADAMKTVAQTSMGTDLDLVVNVDGVMKNFGAMLKMQASSMLGFMSMMTMNQPGMAGQDPAQLQANMQNQIDALFGFLDQTKSMTLGVDFDPQNLLISTMFEAKPGTEMHKGLSDTVKPGRNLSQYLDDGMLRMQMGMDSNSSFYDKYLDFSVKSMGISDPALTERVKAELASWKELGKMNMAVSASVSDAGKLAYQALLELENPEKFDEFVQTKLKTFNSGAMHEGYKEMGMDMNIAVEENVRKVQGLDVTRMKVGVTLLENYPAPPEVAEKMTQLMQQADIEMARDGNLVYITADGTIDPLIARVKSNTVASDLAARMSNPPGGMVYADLDVAGYMKLITAMMPAGQAPAMPNLGDLPPVKLSGYHNAGKAYYRLQIPKSLVQQASSQMMGAGAGAGPEAEAGGGM